MESLKPRRIQLHMTGDRPFFQNEVLFPVLAAFQADPLFAIEFWGLDERAAQAYDQERIGRVAGGKPSPYVLNLKRKKRIQHTTLIRLSRRPGLILSPSPKTPPKDWEHFFEFSDTLAAVYRPELAWVHIFAAPEPPLENAADKAHYRMDMGITGSGPEYESEGPGGLGLRTYLGPGLVERLGRERLLNTPALVIELPWGGMRVDLVAKPWQAPLPEILAAWDAAMQHLRPAAVFAEAEQDEEGNVYFSRARNW